MLFREVEPLKMSHFLYLRFLNRMHFITISETSFNSVQFTEGGSLDLSCSVTSGSYDTITLSKVKGDTAEVMAIFSVDGSTDVKTSEGVASRQEQPEVKVMTLTLSNAGCRNNGSYSCTHDNGQTATGKAIIESIFLLLLFF